MPALGEPATSFFDGLPPPYRSGRGPIRRFFVGSVLSWYGDWLSTVALVVILYELTGNPAGPAGYILVRVAPRVLGPFIGGNLADRLSPRRIIIIGTSVQAAFTASLILSDRAGAIWAIYAAVALAQFAGALVRPSQSAMLPMLVSDAALPRPVPGGWAAAPAVRRNAAGSRAAAFSSPFASPRCAWWPRPTLPAGSRSQ